MRRVRVSVVATTGAAGLVVALGVTAAPAQAAAAVTCAGKVATIVGTDSRDVIQERPATT